MNNGFIKLHRRMLEWEWFSDSKTLHVFLFLLLDSNHTDKKWKGLNVSRGQTITGRIKISAATGLSERKVRTALSVLEQTGEIKVEATSRFSIITICNYNEYQKRDADSDQQTTSKRPANDQQVTTNKNEKNEKKEPLTTHGENSKVKLTQKQIDSLMSKMDYDEMNFWIQKVDNYCELHGKKYSNYSLAVQNFRTRNPGEYSSVAELGQPVIPNSSTQDEADRIKREYNL